MTASRAASSSFKINPQKTAFLVCDIQERFRNAIYGFSEMVAASAKMVKAASILEIPVYATEQNPKIRFLVLRYHIDAKRKRLHALGATVDELNLKSLPDKLNPLGEAKPKTLFSMMIPEVVEGLTRSSISSVVIFGIESHVCVLQTALDCLDRGIDVHIVADAVSSCNKQEIPIALERIRQAGGRITTTESVLFQLMVDSTHPQFRNISKLVKEEKESTTKSLEKLTSHL